MTRKDPIWYVLRKREDANALLHEGALYILGRSLLADNESLYQLMERLRATRNKIVHRGEPPEPYSNQYLSIDNHGSSDALNCANEVLKWLGVGNEYKLHERFCGIVERPVHRAGHGVRLGEITKSPVHATTSGIGKARASIRIRNG
jgi:hypothetical protein